MTLNIPKDRTYLYVPFEEKERVKKLGAHFDNKTKCWYLLPNQDRKKFKRWLAEEDGGAKQRTVYVIESDNAYVAEAHITCWHCEEETTVICIYCKTGKIDGAPYTRFSVSEVTAIDRQLKQQLKPWPTFRLGKDPEMHSEHYINHCSQCGVPQSDFMLHMEPGSPFCSIEENIKNKQTKLIPLKDRVRLNGNEGFELTDDDDED